MHDRRVNGEALTFGNQGALFMNAMTWWDWKTYSIWSQPWGTAIVGPLEGKSLTLIPASIVPWSTWRAEQPETTVLANDLDHRPFSGAATPLDNFVIGVALKDSATAYYYELAAERRIINDRIGERPVVVFVDPDTRDIRVYLQRPGAGTTGHSTPSELVFELDDDRVVDAATGSVWDIMRGVAIEGPLMGSVLQRIPYVTAFDWAWRDFFPHTTFYAAEELLERQRQR